MTSPSYQSYVSSILQWFIPDQILKAIFTAGGNKPNRDYTLQLMQKTVSTWRREEQWNILQLILNSLISFLASKNYCSSVAKTFLTTNILTVEVCAIRNSLNVQKIFDSEMCFLDQAMELTEESRSTAEDNLTRTWLIDFWEAKILPRTLNVFLTGAKCF